MKVILTQRKMYKGMHEYVKNVLGEFGSLIRAEYALDTFLESRGLAVANVVRDDQQKYCCWYLKPYNDGVGLCYECLKLEW